MFNEKTYSQKMDKTIEVFQKELTSLRTGRANASMLDLVKVDVYGQAMPLNQVSSITTPMLEQLTSKFGILIMCHLLILQLKNQN